MEGLLLTSSGRTRVGARPGWSRWARACAGRSGGGCPNCRAWPALLMLKQHRVDSEPLDDSHHERCAACFEQQYARKTCYPASNLPPALLDLHPLPKTVQSEQPQTQRKRWAPTSVWKKIAFCQGSGLQRWQLTRLCVPTTGVKLLWFKDNLDPEKRFYTEDEILDMICRWAVDSLTWPAA